MEESGISDVLLDLLRGVVKADLRKGTLRGKDRPSKEASDLSAHGGCVTNYAECALVLCHWHQQASPL